jgi:hypothetical protein
MTKRNSFVEISFRLAVDGVELKMITYTILYWTYKAIAVIDLLVVRGETLCFLCTKRII